jgi:hypothetical protein
MSPLEAELISLMLDEITLEPRTGVDKFNNFTYGTSVTVRCQVVRINRRSLSRDGREIISTVQIILADPTLTVTADDRLTLPDGTRPAIIEVLSAKDNVGDYYLEIRA